MIPVTVIKTRILITEQSFEVGYQFNDEGNRMSRIMYEIYTPEEEVFKSLDEFIAVNKVDE